MITLNPKSARYVILAALIIALLVAYTLKYEAESDLQISAFTTASPSRVPGLAVRHRKAVAGAPVAFLVHGHQCSKSMMIQLAKYLALNGVNSYAIDLPGHGASPEVFSEARAHDAAKEALAYLIARNELPADRLVLIGHSYGTKILGRIAVEPGSYAAFVGLGPVYVKGFSPRLPKDLLILTAERDYDFIVREARLLMSDATGRAVEGPETGWGDGSRHEARLWHVVPDCGHVSLIFSPTSFREVLKWIELSTGYRAPEEKRPATQTAVFLFALVIVGTVFAASQFGRGQTPAPGSPPGESGSLLRPWLVLAYGWFGALLLTYSLNCGWLGAHPLSHFTPLRFVRLEEGESLAAFLFAIGVLSCALDFGLCRGAHLPQPRQILRGLPLGLAAAGIIYVAASLFVTGEFYHLSFTWSDPARVGIAAILAVSLFPFFAVYEGVFDEVRRRGGNKARGQILAFVGVCLYYGLLAGSLPLVGFRLERFAAYLFLLGIFCAGLGAILRKMSNNSTAAAAFSALISAWIIAVTFMRY